MAKDGGVTEFLAGERLTGNKFLRLFMMWDMKDHWLLNMKIQYLPGN